MEIGSRNRGSGNLGAVYKYVVNTINNATTGAGVDYQILGIPTATGSYNSDGTAVNRMTIRYDGNVGIGTASPGYKLSVQTSGYTNAPGTNIINNGAAGSTASNIAYSDYITYYQTNPATEITSYNLVGGYQYLPLRLSGNPVTVTTGNFGIGTLNPIRTLHVNGGEISHTPSITTAFYNVSDSAGSNGGSYSLAVRGLGSSGTAQVNLAGFYVYAGVNVFSGVIRPNSSANTPQTFYIPNSGGSAQWYKIGTAGMSQGGLAIKVTITSMAGYNAANYQNSIVTIYFKTSNSSSVDPNGFAGDSIYWADINSAGSFTVKWKANGAGISATAYDLYVYMPAFTGASSFYTVEYDSNNVIWTGVMATGQADPGVGSSTVCIATFQRSWYATYTGINRTDPGYALDVSGDINASSTLRIGGLTQPRLISSGTFTGVTTFDTVTFDLVNYNIAEIRMTVYFNTTNQKIMSSYLLDTVGTVYSATESGWQMFYGTGGVAAFGTGAYILNNTEIAGNGVGGFIVVIRVIGNMGISGAVRNHWEWTTTGCYAGIGASTTYGRATPYNSSGATMNRMRFNLSGGTMTGKYSIINYST
jgi:hypothetical protein